jgi:hypothetical protein
MGPAEGLSEATQQESREARLRRAIELDDLDEQKPPEFIDLSLEVCETASCYRGRRKTAFVTWYC